MSSASRGLAPRKGLKCSLMKMGHTCPLVEPRHGPQAGNSGDPRSQDTDNAWNICHNLVGDEMEAELLIELLTR